MFNYTVLFIPSYHLLFRSLDHPNIVHYFGIYSAPNGVHYIVTEFLSKGSLLHFLHSEKDNLTTVDLLNISKQTAAGMNYLESKNIIHRDLAARNILVNENGVKVADFGMSRKLESSYYATENKSVPVKWSAPEAIQKGVFTFKSDVWSFGRGLYFTQLFSHSFSSHRSDSLGSVQLWRCSLSNIFQQEDI